MSYANETRAGRLALAGPAGWAGDAHDDGPLMEWELDWIDLGGEG